MHFNRFGPFALAKDRPLLLSWTIHFPPKPSTFASPLVMVQTFSNISKVNLSEHFVEYTWEKKSSDSRSKVPITIDPMTAIIPANERLRLVFKLMFQTRSLIGYQ